MRGHWTDVCGCAPLTRACASTYGPVQWLPLHLMALAAHISKNALRRDRRGETITGVTGNYATTTDGKAITEAYEDFYGNGTANIGESFATKLANTNPKMEQFLAINSFDDRKSAFENGHFDDAEEPLVFYKGHVQLMTPEGWKTVCENTGHLGVLDCPDEPGLRGQYRFSDKP